MIKDKCRNVHCTPNFQYSITITYYGFNVIYCFADECEYITFTNLFMRKRAIRKCMLENQNILYSPLIADLSLYNEIVASYRQKIVIDNIDYFNVERLFNSILYNGLNVLNGE